MSDPDPPVERSHARQDQDRAWMLPLLDELFGTYTETAAIRMLRDDVARAAVAPLLVEALADRGVTGVDLESRTGDNLLQGLLALRAKFPWAEARKRVELNIAMSGGER